MTSFSKRIRINKKNFLILFILIIIYKIAFSFSLANEQNLNKANKKNDPSYESIINNTEYLIGPNDVLSLNYIGINELNNVYRVGPDGFIYLPEVGKIYVNGFTVSELKLLLNEKYKEFIIEPYIEIKLIGFRPVSIYISGEVKKPGLYNFVRNEGKIFERSAYNLDLLESRIDINSIKNSNTVNSYDFVVNPTLFDALRISKGVLNSADLTNIEVIRKNSKTNGGGMIKTNLDLTKLLKYGDQSQNIPIYDGDSIIVNKGKGNLKEQILLANNSNLSPGIITVYVTGNVFQVGPANLRQGSTLLEAISSTGGKKILTGNIEFLRFNDDGTTTRKSFKYNKKALSNSDRNPILMDGDIINVKRTMLGKATVVLKEVSSPLLSGFGIYSIFN